MSVSTFEDVRNPDLAHAWGDDDSDVWVGRRRPSEPVELPKSYAELVAFAEKWLPLGWLADAGVPIETEVDSEQFTAFQGSQEIKEKITNTSRSFTVQALEESFRVGELYWDHGEPQLVTGTEGRETITELPATLKTINAWAILRFVDGDYWKIYVFPRVTISDRGTLEHQNSELSIYEMTARIIGKGWMITNNPDYAKRATYVAGLPAGEEPASASYIVNTEDEAAGQRIASLDAGDSARGNIDDDSSEPIVTNEDADGATS